MRLSIVRRWLPVLAALSLASLGLVAPSPAAASGSATVVSYEHSDLAGSGRPLSYACAHQGQKSCFSVANLDTVTGPCKPWIWSASTWNDCISSTYVQNYTTAFIVVIYSMDANYSGGGWPVCVRPGTTWWGNALSVLNDKYSSIRAEFYASNPGRMPQGNC